MEFLHFRFIEFLFKVSWVFTELGATIDVLRQRETRAVQVPGPCVESKVLQTSRPSQRKTGRRPGRQSAEHNCEKYAPLPRLFPTCPERWSPPTALLRANAVGRDWSQTGGQAHLCFR